MSVKRALTVFPCGETAKRITHQHCHLCIGLSCNSSGFFFFSFFNIEYLFKFEYLFYNLGMMILETTWLFQWTRGVFPLGQFWLDKVGRVRKCSENSSS